jgi:hypothetical protein
MKTHAKAPAGYVIEVVGSTWLWEYRARSDQPMHYRGDPTNMEPKKLGHEAPSMLLKAKFAVWAFSMVPSALARHRDPPEFEAAMHRVDATGRMLAVLLRGEIGAGPVILYADIFRDLCGGMHVWQVMDDGVLMPYFHQPSAGYVIEHGDSGGWAWEYRPAHRVMKGAVAGCRERWQGDLPIERDLVCAFARWHAQWSAAANPVDPGRRLDEDAHVSEGLALAAHLKSSLGEFLKVIYVQPLANCAQDNHCASLDVQLDGSTRPYAHKPYWAESEDLYAES